ncbi:uracil-DNA glycosylase [Rhodococcus kroppenstedtii]|uniref:uracil-DNA glycosylase n=1 Tax=Rhodococcoides kroppenstedtii TaxID=293050 RepID=UPI001C9B1221|nr:uracil-DNA glycosylase [Rhodococcus kroppenstedtii]MBY6436890.1 uracil-DNA glycosylase [Rhodococcus kroppenstedtii]
MSVGIDWSGKRARVHGAPVAELNAVVDRWTRERQTSIPWFDPDDGGVTARVLVLLESPGPKTVRAGGTMMCSFDNPDTTNPVLKSALEHAGVDRSSCVKWNVVPWAVLDTDGHPAAPTASTLADSAPYLQEILARLPDLEVVLVLGAKALDGYMRTTTASAPARLVPVVAAPHPSARNSHATAVARQRLINAAMSIAAHLDQG